MKNETTTCADSGFARFCSENDCEREREREEEAEGEERYMNNRTNNMLNDIMIIYYDSSAVQISNSLL